MDEASFKLEGVNHVTLSSGRNVSLPVRYLDWTGVMAHFPAPAAAVRKLLPSPKLKPALLWPGTAILSIAAMEYRRLADMGPYNEVAVMTAVLYAPALNLPALPLLTPSLFPSFGFFILRMPVTTRDALDLGVEGWGYPKLVTDIDFEEIGNIRRCRVHAGGHEALTLDVAQNPAKFARVDFPIYTVKDGALLRHRVETEGLYGFSWLPGGGAVSFGDHPLGRELAAIGAGRQPIARIFASNVRSLLHEADARLPL